MKHIYLLLLFGFSSLCFSQTLVTYNFTGAPGNQANQATSSVAANMSADPITRGSSVFSNAIANTIASTGWTTSTSINANDYYEFSITPAAGYLMTLGVLSLAEGRSNNGPRDMAIRTSLDGFSTNIFTQTIPDNNSVRNRSFDFGSLPGNLYNNLSEEITIRIYGYSSENGFSGIWVLTNNSSTGNLQLTGTVTPGYCNSNFVANDDDAITNVTLNTLNNSSGDAHATNANGYEDFTAVTPTDLEIGQTYNLEVSIDPNGSFQYDVWAFFDWDGDLIFESSVDLGDRNTVGSLNANVTVPSNAVVGNTRMRIVMINAATPNACSPQPSAFGETEDYTINITPATGYCASSFPAIDADAITNVTLNTLNNSSGDAHASNANGYEDFTAITPTDLERGQTYNLEVSIDPDGLFQYDVWVFFDWNGDFVFDESIDLGDRDTAGSLNVDITVPFSAELGQTRMRVVMINAETPMACDPQPWVFGETEDYTINIINPTSYCTALGDTSFDTSITEVTFNGTTNTSSLSGHDDPSGYIAFATPIFQATQGEDYTLSVNLNTDGNFTVHAIAWIDWNQDFIFDPITEQYDLGDVLNTSNGPTSLSGLTVSVPNNAIPGETKMRIASQFLVDPAGPCAGSEDGEIEDYIINITPITYVYNNGWLPANPEVVATIHNPIEIQAGNVTLSDNTSCNNFTIAPGNNLTINAGVTLTVQNGLTLQSVSNNYSGLILNGTIDGTVTYQRYVNVIGSGTTSANDLVSAPLSGQTFGDFATANAGILAASGNIRAWAPFNNTAGAYQNYNVVANANTVLEAGMGYRAATTSGDVLNFTGTVETGTVSRNITVGPGNFKEWNLVGNPYPSYISMEAFLQHEVAPGVSNISLLDNASGIYGYDGTAQNGWEVVTLANAAGRFMAPGQGFFVAADEAQAGSFDIEFTPAMRSVASGDDFIPGRTAPLTFLKLLASRGNQSYHTEFYFNANASDGLDPGYDAQTWGGTNSGFILYSHLVADNTGVPIALQALHPDALNEVRIPLGINVTSGQTISFSIADAQLPAGTEVYLEDTVNNSITLITQNNYQVTLQSGINGTGRFFLRFTNGTLSNNEVNAQTLNIYHQAQTQQIVIAGQLTNNTSARLYDLQGRTVRSAQLNASQLEQRLDVSGLSTGVYILNFDNNGNTVSKKLMIH